jgi:2-oxoglutarate ferredoxin oxidoreductase subunit beta
MSNVERYLRKDKLPHIWCPGCGNGIVLGAFLRAIDKLNLDQNKVAAVSGIGCSSRATGYVDFHTIHTTHGRALAFATGVKFARPDLKVIVFSGDGDATAIGGNHFIHACRRNIDMTMIIFNNNIYGMTGGQYSPTTPYMKFASTCPYGNFEQPFAIAELAIAAGASYVARGTTYDAAALDNLIIKGIQKKGFSVIEVLCGCPTIYGRRNKLPAAVDLMKWQKEITMPFAKWSQQTDDEKKKYLPTGILWDAQKPEFTEEYAKICEIASKEKASEWVLL